MFIFYFSYDGSCCVNSGVNEPPRGRSAQLAAPSSRFSCKNNSSSETGIHWRTSSVGAADFRGGGCAKTKSKMSDLNITRGHSPHFSPSRNNCKFTHFNKPVSRIY